MEMENYKKDKSGEALMFAATKKQTTISTIDYNGRQPDGDTDDVLSLGDLNVN